MSPILHEQDDIVRDSIIKNKEKIKSYWEQLMLADAANNADVGRRRSLPRLTSSNSNSNSNRNSVCSIDSTGSGEVLQGVESELRNVKEEKRRIEQEMSLRELYEDQAAHNLRMEEKIALELRDMQQREEELRHLRQHRLSNVTEVSTCVDDQDGSNCSEYGSDEKDPSLDGSARGSIQRRAQSLESVSSGLSSGSGTTRGSDSQRDPTLDVPRRRQVTVRPFQDPDVEETPTFNRNDKETPIEREIRLACEREEELRKAQGVQPPAQEQFTGKKFQLGRKDALENDTRGVQLRLATNRIQQEIEEASEREIQLRTEGKILTTSIETVDGKVTRFTQLAEQAMLDGEKDKEKARKMRRSASTTSIAALTAIESQPKRPSLDSRKFLSRNSQRGLMERFIATKGRMGAKNTVPPLVLPASVAMEPIEAPTSPKEIVPPSRNGFLSAEEKIQSELKEMKKREEELRLQRAHAFARSQPNLLTICDDGAEAQGEQEVDGEGWRREGHASLPLYASNPNLAEHTPTASQKSYRKRFSLLEQWENRIQNS